MPTRPAPRNIPGRRAARARDPGSSHSTSETKLSQVVIDVLVCPSVPVLAGHGSNHEMGNRETVGGRGSQLGHTVDDPKAVPLEFAGAGTLAARIHAGPGLGPFRPRHRRIQHHPFEDRSGLPRRGRPRGDPNPEDGFAGVAQVAEHLARGQRSPATLVVRSQAPKPADEASAGFLLSNRMHDIRLLKGEPCPSLKHTSAVAFCCNGSTDGAHCDTRRARVHHPWTTRVLPPRCPSRSVEGPVAA